MMLSIQKDRQVRTMQNLEQLLRANFRFGRMCLYFIS